MTIQSYGLKEREAQGMEKIFFDVRRFYFCRTGVKTQNLKDNLAKLTDQLNDR